MIPKVISHNGEHFVLKDVALNQRKAKKIRRNLRNQKRLRSRIKFYDNKYCVYKEVRKK